MQWKSTEQCSQQGTAMPQGASSAAEKCPSECCPHPGLRAGPQHLLSVVHLADNGVIGVADGWGVRRPRLLVADSSGRRNTSRVEVSDGTTTSG